MRIVNRIAICVFLLTCGAWQAAAGNVFALPSSSFDPSVAAYTDSPFQSAGTLATSAGPLAVLAKPDGSKFYVVTTDFLYVVDSSFTTILSSFSLSQPAKAAVLTPDGRRLLVLAGTLRIFDTTTANDDEITLSPAPDVGQDPTDLAVSLNSKLVFVLSDASDRLKIFDLSTNQVIGGATTITGVSTGVSVAPNGLVYVSSTNSLYEIDGTTGVVRGKIGLNAFPGKAVFTPDGRYAVVSNQVPVTGLALLIDLQSRSLVGVIPPTGSNPELALDQLTVVDDNRVFAVSTSTQRLVEITVSPFEVRTTGFLFSNQTDVRAARASNESPVARYLFAATSNTIFRGNIASSASESLSLPLAPKRLVLAGAASTGTPVAFRKFNDEQSVLGGATTLPLILRVFDVNGAPVFNRSVQFSTATPDVVIETPSTATSTDGFAGTRITVPDAPGIITVTASVNGLSTAVTFQVTVAGGGGGGPGTGGLSIFSGDGQLVEKGYPTREPLEVRLTDAQGSPITGATIEWTLEGDGTLSPAGGSPDFATSLTDINGVAKITYIGPFFIFTTTSWVQSTVTASAPNFNSVDFTVTAIPNLLGGQPAIPTIVLLDPPQANRKITGKAGQTLAGAVRVQVTAIAGFQSGQGIPGIGVEVTTGLDPLTGPTASCANISSLSDSTGVAVCDVVFGGVTGTVPATVKVGGGIREFSVTLTVEQGLAGQVEIVGGNNQSGEPGATLPVLLQAEVSDGLGHPLAGIPVTWEAVVPGTVNITNATAASNSQGIVTAMATLGDTPGVVMVRVTAGSETAVFTLTVNVPISSLSKVSGDNQSAIANQGFAQPLVVEVRNAENQPVAGVTVSFSATGSATLGSPGATTDSQGRASTTVTAGATAGPVVVTAEAPGVSPVSFSLTVAPPGPVVTLTDIRGAISGDMGVSPGSIVAIYGRGLAEGIQGSVVGNSNLVGPLPTRLANVEVMFGAVAAPIYSVNNVNGQQSVVVQAPFELAAPGTIAVTIKVGGGSTVVNNVAVKAFQPGIFETLAEGGKRYAVLLKEDGSFVSPSNPASRGERIRMFCSGLGQTNPPAGTNRAGIPGQTVNASLVVGINDAGVAVVSQETWVGVVGVYMISFDVPLDTPATGPERPFAIAIIPDDGGAPIFGNPSTISIQ